MVSPNDFEKLLNPHNLVGDLDPFTQTALVPVALEILCHFVKMLKKGNDTCLETQKTLILIPRFQPCKTVRL